MNLLFYLPDLATGGILTVTKRLSSALKKRGHSITWLIYESSSNLSNIPEDQECYFLPTQELESSLNIEYLNSLLKEKGIDVIINQHGQFEGDNLLTHRDHSIQSIAVYHHNPLLNIPWLAKDLFTLKNHSIIEHIKRYVRLALYWDVKRRILKNCKARLIVTEHSDASIVTLSESFNPTIASLNPRIKRIKAIGNPNTYHDPKPHLDTKKKTVLFVGRLENGQKKISYLINIWKRIYKQAPDWELLIVGDGKDKEFLINQAKGINSIQFLGFQDPEPFYKEASIICLTSLFEGFGMSLTEGMQYGCVPIAFNSYPALNDIIDNGVNGISVKPFKKRQYAKQLFRLMKHEDYRKRLAENAIESVKKFDLDRIVDQWEDFLAEINNHEI